MLQITLTEKLALAAAVGATATAAVLVQAALNAESQLFGRTLIAGRDPGEIALTYDDGPNPAATPQLLDLLARHDARATFFMIGRWVRDQPALARQVHAAGHLVANHTMTHPWLTTKSARVIREEIRGCNEALEDALGETVRYFRAPHGARRPVVLRAARELGLTPVQWNVMGHDWKPIGAAGIVRCIDAGLARARMQRRGANILLHDGFDVSQNTDRTGTVAATAELLQRFAREQAKLVTVDAWG